MGLHTAKRRKMTEFKLSESTQTSSDTKEIELLDETHSSYARHYDQPFYVDKTLLIKELFKKSHVLITAPSCFGKSLNLDMVRRFVEIEVDKYGDRIWLNVDKDKLCMNDFQPRSKNFKLFREKKIFKENKFMYQHFGKYPTIYVDFSTVQGKDFNEILTALRRIVHTAFEEHAYLKGSDIWDRLGFNKKTFMKYLDTEEFQSLNKDETIYGLQILSKYLHGHFGTKVFVFIDEFDMPVNQMVYMNRMSPEDRQETIELFQLVIQSLLKGNNKFVERSLSNACQQLGGILLDSANNVKLYSFMQKHSFAEFYGFKEDEVVHLLKVANKSDHFDLVKSKFNGFLTKSRDGTDINMYSPLAIINYISSDEYVDEWSAGIRSEIFKLMGHPRIKEKITLLMNGKSVEITYRKKFDLTHIDKLSRMLNQNDVDDDGIDLFVQFLYEMGFFYPIASSDESLTLKVPNTTVCDKLKRILYNIHLDQKYPIELDEKFIKALDAVAESCNYSNVLDLAKGIADLFKSADPPLRDGELQASLFAYIQKKLKMSNIECITDTNTGCDVILVNRRRKCGIIFEVEPLLDRHMTSVKGHNHILDNIYDTLLNESSLKRLFPNSPITLTNKIVMSIKQIHRVKVLIEYSCGHKRKTRTVISK
ncbi:hypothetical protein PV326_008164 [Microctonus aethiopoides]|nr:hypothetical protein PV326_008164 [Microctonus aethiopoides]